MLVLNQHLLNKNLYFNSVKLTNKYLKNCLIKGYSTQLTSRSNSIINPNKLNINYNAFNTNKSLLISKNLNFTRSSTTSTGESKSIKAFVKPYMELARVDKPIGTMLLLWPCGKLHIFIVNFLKH
jgi:hypothetical protein